MGTPNPFFDRLGVSFLCVAHIKIKSKLDEEDKIMKKENRNHLPMVGVGPFIVLPQILFTIFAIRFSSSKMPQMKIDILKIPFLIIGIILIVFSIWLWYAANYKAKIDVNIKENKLATGGVYAYVRNPIYSAFWIACIGVIFIANNLILFIVPIINWIYMTVFLKNSEEKWLRNLYGEEYDEYCSKVNRCIPWMKRKR